MNQKRKFPWMTYGLEVLAGAIIGPANFFVSMFYYGTKALDPARFPTAKNPGIFQNTKLTTGVLWGSSDSFLFFVLPCILSTAILAPFFLSQLGQIRLEPRLQCFKKCSVGGVLFGFCATFLTLSFMFLFALLDKGSIELAIGIPVYAFIVGVLFNIALLPSILITGTLFGVLSRYLLAFEMTRKARAVI